MTEATHTWHDHEKVHEYVGRVNRLAARQAGEAELVQALPEHVQRVLDLGCGDGKLAAVVLEARPEMEAAVCIDRSAPMLDLARQRFAAEPRARLLEHDLDQPLPDLGAFDAIVSGFAIHHLEDARKQALLSEAADALRPGGVFANLEVIQCATDELQQEFYRRIERPGGDPEDRLASIEPQLDWMRDAGLVHVDCQWRWRGFALLVGQAP
ncbi:MAG: class I SAM-dependent methyltransferase [Acidimicrobiales bacterium]